MTLGWESRVWLLFLTEALQKGASVSPLLTLGVPGHPQEWQLGSSEIMSTRVHTHVLFIHSQIIHSFPKGGEKSYVLHLHNPMV